MAAVLVHRLLRLLSLSAVPGEDLVYHNVRRPAEVQVPKSQDAPSGIASSTVGQSAKAIVGDGPSDCEGSSCRRLLQRRTPGPGLQESHRPDTEPIPPRVSHVVSRCPPVSSPTVVRTLPGDSTRYRYAAASLRCPVATLARTWECPGGRPRSGERGYGWMGTFQTGGSPTAIRRVSFASRPVGKSLAVAPGIVGKRPNRQSSGIARL